MEMHVPFSLPLELIKLASELTPQRRGELGDELYSWLQNKVPRPEIARRIDALTLQEAAYMRISTMLLDQLGGAVGAIEQLNQAIGKGGELGITGARIVPAAPTPPPTVEIRPAVAVGIEFQALQFSRQIRPERRMAMVEKLVETSNIEPEDEAERALTNWIETLPEYEAAFIFLLLDVSGQLAESGEFGEDDIAHVALDIVEAEIAGDRGR